MNRDDVIRWAREAGIGWGEGIGGMPDFLERFAALVAAAEREAGQKWFDAITAQHKQEILAEREACAKLCEEEGLLWGQRYAAAIRARKELT